MRPAAPDAWIDDSRTKVGYELPFTRLFYRYAAPRPIGEIDKDISLTQKRILTLLGEIAP